MPTKPNNDSNTTLASNGSTDQVVVMQGTLTSLYQWSFSMLIISQVPMVVVKLPSSSTKVVRPMTRQDPRTGTSSAGSKLSQRNLVRSKSSSSIPPAGIYLLQTRPIRD